MKAKAAVFLEPSAPMEIREYPIPDVESDSVLIKVKYANICGSDLHKIRVAEAAAFMHAEEATLNTSAAHTENTTTSTTPH